jgi:hypothetical protein
MQGYRENAIPGFSRDARTLNDGTVGELLVETTTQLLS